MYCMLQMNSGCARQISKGLFSKCSENSRKKKWDPGILDTSRFSAQIRKVEARLGKLAKIRKVETN